MTALQFYDPLALDALVVRRTDSIFASDVALRRAAIAERLAGARVLVVGGGGSIGSVTTSLLVAFRPRAIHIVDQNENYLAEVVRDLRSRADHDLGGIELRALPLDYGSPVMQRLLAEMPRYDVVMNFAAMKHVRSEKDAYSLLQMLDVNLIRHQRFLEWLTRHGHGTSYFAVSTDKAANPTSLMGASKRLMENLVFAHRQDELGLVTTSARFANVAFSNGSLLQAFLERLARRQPLAAPRETRRYFVSRRESGELCLLAACALADRHVAFPRLDPESELQTLESIAVRVLEHFGLTAERFDDEHEARKSVAALAREQRWPLFLTPRDTSGEKEYEEFVGVSETAIDLGLKHVGALAHRAEDKTLPLVGRLAAALEDAPAAIDKATLVAWIADAVPNLQHVETGKSLDERP